MQIFNIGGGEIIVIILLAVIFFRPQDIVTMMRQLGRWTRKAMRAWAEFSRSLEAEYATEDIARSSRIPRRPWTGVNAALKDISETVNGEVNEAGEILESEARDSARGLKTASEAPRLEPAPRPPQSSRGTGSQS